METALKRVRGSRGLLATGSSRQQRERARQHELEQRVLPEPELEPEVDEQVT
ncbi:hypothetical protein A2U01_0027011 [Trifolium medium]|uniref:Uncharacterized protein n=1 Tax=Trifolium medium TaxID=97028 RepID=A0A392P3S2_9FABA|nr:hypothetical protein [Trifolium medium]